MEGIDKRLKRIQSKVAAKGVRLRPPSAESEVLRFESKHGIVLPEGYRRFILEVGSSGPGPPEYRLVKLGKAASDMDPESKRNWTRLPHVAEPFPFRRMWCWEDEEYDDEEAFEAKLARIYRGNIFLGNDGCGMYWHLIVTGAERGHIWHFTGEGIVPTKPKRDFLCWYEDWLDGVEDWWGSA
jgi:hypothetical protein